MLCAVSSKKTLLALWADLKETSKAELEAEIAKAQAAIAAGLDDKGQPATLPRRRPAPRSDRPSARIARQLTETLGLEENEAVSALTAALQESGVDRAKIPRSDRRSLTEWIDALLERVSGSVVMGAAHRIAPK